MKPRRSPRQILTWTVVLATMAATLTVLWNMVIVQDYIRLVDLAKEAAISVDVTFRWLTFVLGIIFLLSILTGLLVLGIKLLREVDFNQRQSDFIAGVSHEFKSPLAAIRLNTETLLTREVDPEKQKLFLKGILDETERLTALVSNILAAGKIDLNRQQYAHTTLQLGSYLEQYRNQRTRVGVHDDGYWDLKIGESVPISIDTTAFNMVLDNLLENAVKYSGNKGKVVVECAAEPGAAIIRVKDNGIGLDPEDKKHLFERFYRGKHQPKRRVPGTGLGLFLVRHIVANHQGDINLISEGIGKGVVAEVRLPQATGGLGGNAV